MTFRSRVQRRIDEYDLDIGDLKHQYQTGEKTVKEIKHQLNIAIVEAAMVEAGDDPNPGEAKYNYKYVRDDQYPKERQLAFRRLREIGVDPEALESDLLFREHIENHLGIEHDPMR